jgi:hypothetical protein
MVNAQRSNPQPDKAQPQRAPTRAHARHDRGSERVKTAGEKAFGRFNGVVRDDFSP